MLRVSLHIQGKAIANAIRMELKAHVDEMKRSYNIVPGLAVILVGERKDSVIYVAMKKKPCEEIGIRSFGYNFPIEVTQKELISKISELNTGSYPSLLSNCFGFSFYSTNFSRSKCPWYIGSTPSPRSHR